MDSKEIYKDLSVIVNNFDFFFTYSNVYSLDQLFNDYSLKKHRKNCLDIAKKYNKQLELNDQFINDLYHLLNYLVKLYNLFLKDSN